MKHWLTNDTTTIDGTLSLERDPSPDSAGSFEGQKTWFDYTGKTNASYAGTQVLPLCVAKVLPDGTTRFIRTERNLLGLVTRSVETYANGAL
jgi:hypothetical protein